MAILNSIKKNIISALADLGHLWLEKSILRALQLTIILIIGQIGLIFFFYPKLPPLIPLYYSHPWGESQLAGPIFLLLLPGTSFFFTFLNLALAVNFLEKRKFLSIILSWTSVIVSLFSLITLAKIITISI